ncbi:biopolymer transporter ExbD [Ideonella azotifigens]|uniref:Biopolymer transporter ExbD n=1 Tax=Ideonella azotifigens TaxID=513160 RepID=A0ABP3VNF5_9BURK|nr:biopolymer transporter ExbD [Ideonella azotifigens]MCD2340721.1 biopolymer transporter ExbD [Ideonella azotifigens]
MRVRRLRKETAHLEVTAFINLIVVLVPFLLSTAVFTKLAVMDLSLPAPAAGVMQLQVDKLQLEVVIRPDALDVGDRVGGLILHIPNTADGAYDFKALNAEMLVIKQRFPDEKAASVLAQANTPYETLVQAMDAMRATPTPDPAHPGRTVSTELFPALAIGDAPVKSAGAAAPAPATAQKGK